MRLRSVSSLIFVLLCSTHAFAESGITFNNQIVRVFQQHCQNCHRPGNIAPFSLLTYAETRPHASQIRDAVASRQMPPWKPVNAHAVFEGERSLTDQEVQTITQWVADGSPEGAASDKPEAISFPEMWGAGEPNIVVQPPDPYTLQAGAADIYRCFTMPVDSRSDVYVRGYEVLPGNRKIVHHVLLFLDESGQSLALDNAEPGPGYTCFGGPGFLTGLGMLGGWAPGVSPQMFPLGNGVRIPAGSRIVMQVHYSTAEASAAGGTLDPDRTLLGLYLSSSPLRSITFLPIVNPLFTIPAGDSHYQVKAFLIIPSEVELVAIAPHMHLLGREVTVEARFPNGQRRQLIRIDDWDFHWQGNYTFREPITLPAGAIIEMTAYYDNSTNNPKNPANPPVPVRWGERTTDEMCLTFISVKSPGTPSMSSVPFSVTDRGTTSVTTLGGGNSLQVGHARVSDASGAAPSGLAILGYRQSGVLISEAGVPASPLLTRGRVYAGATADVRSGLAIANPNSDAASVYFFFTDSSGREAASGTTTIPANGQIAAFLNEAPFNGPSTFTGTFTFSSLKPVSVVALRGLVNERSEFLITTLPVVDLESSPSTAPAVFPHFADGGGWRSEITLLNPTDSAISGTLRFADAPGQTTSTSNYSIAARSAVQFATSGSGDAIQSGTVWIVPSANNAAPAGSLVFSYRKANIRVTEAGVAASPAGPAFRIYVESSGTVQSGVAITNTSPRSATVRLELINLSGASVAGTTLTLAANAQLARFLNQIPGFETLSLPFQGLLRITSSSPVAAVGLRGRYNERADFLLTTTPPVSESASAPAELFFPHFVDAGGYTTQFILFSSGAGRSIGGNVRFFSQSGQPLDLKLR